MNAMTHFCCFAIRTAVLTLATASLASAATLVVANKAEATASLIDLDSGAVVATLPTGEGPHEVAISPDGATALVANYGNRQAPGSTLTAIDVAGARVIKTIDLGEYRRPHGVVWLADGRSALVTAEHNQALLKVDVEGGRVEAAIGTDQEISHMVAVTPDGARAFVANIGSGSVTVIDVATGERVANVATGAGAEGVTVAAGGRQVWVTNRAADTVTVLDAASLDELATLESPGFPIRAVATPDGARVLVTHARSGELAIFDTAEPGAVRRLELKIEAKDVSGRLFGDRFGSSSVPIGVVVDPQGRRAFIAHANADVISEVDLDSGKTLRLLRAGKEPDGMGYSVRSVDKDSAGGESWPVLALPLAAGDWPLWSGPDHDLTSLGNGVLGERFGLEPVWSKPLGSGYSGIAVVGERLVTAFSAGESDFLVALDAHSGAQRWRYRMAAAHQGHEGSDDGPIATPAVHAGRVYALTPGGRLVAVRLADGREVWSRQLVDEFGARKPYYGFNSTPTVIGEVLVIETGGANGHAITGLDPQTGELLWSTEDDRVGYQSPTPLCIGGEVQVFAVTDFHVLGLRPKTGELLWKLAHRLDEGHGQAQAVPVGEDRVLVSEWTRTGLFRVTRTEGGYRAEELWRTRALSNTLAMPVPYQGHLYGFRGRFLTCVDAASGETVWKSRPPGEGNLVIVDGHLVILTRKGDVVVAAATPEGYREKARVKALETGHYTRPSFAAGHIYVRNLDRIASIGVSDRVVAATETPEIALRGKLRELVRHVQQAEDKRPLIDDFLAAQKEFPILDGDLVHFVFRGETEDLALAGNMLPHAEQLPMHRIEGTDFHFRSLALEPGGFFIYSFALFDQRQLDPLNPRRFTIPVQEHGGFTVQEHSVLTTPGWQEPAHLRPGAGPRGRIEKLPWKSEILGDAREVRVYLPPGYDEREGRYPLLVVHLGNHALRWGKMNHTLDNLIGKSVAPLVVAFVPRGYAVPELYSAAAEYSRALAEELVPLLDENYRTLARPEARGVMGASSGARVSIYAAFRQPGVFGKVAVQSFFMDRMEAEIVGVLSASVHDGR